MVDGIKMIELLDEVEELTKAAEEVVECLVLENMKRPSFTFDRIEKLAKVMEELSWKQPLKKYKKS